MRPYLIPAFAALLLAGCAPQAGEMRVDGSSEKAYLASMQTIAAKLPAEKYRRFLAAAIALRKQSLIKFFTTHNTDDDELIQSTTRMSIDGLTVDQVIAKGETLPPQPAVIRPGSSTTDGPSLSDDKLEGAAMEDAGGSPLRKTQ